MMLKFRSEPELDLSKNILYDGWYLDGHFFICYCNDHGVIVKREVTLFADDELKTYFKMIDLVKEHEWSLCFKLIHKYGGYYDIDLESIH